MKIITKISELKDVGEYLSSRNLGVQYSKAKRLLLLGYPQSVDFKMREPKSLGLWYFRVNKQYRAIGFFVGEELKIFEIDDHQ